MKSQGLTKATAFNLFSRLGLGILGFLQVVLIAKAFGVSVTTDAYMVAIWIPLFVWGMGDSVLIYALVPYLVSIQVKEGSKSANEAANHIFSWFLLVLLAVSIMLYLCASPLVYILVPGFSKEAKLLTVELLRWLSPSVFLGGLAAFFASLLFSIRKFAVPAVTALFPDLGAIGFILFGIKKWGIKAVVIGFIIGVSIQLIILFFTLLRTGIFPRFIRPKFTEFMKTAKLMGPRVGGVGLNRAIVGVDRFFASMLGAGSVSLLAYSFRLTQLPVSLAVAAFGKTLMPTLSKEIAEGNMENVRKLIPRFIGFVFFGLAPIVLLLIYYSEPIIRLIYERGAFTSEATRLAANVLIFYSLAILFSSITVIFSGIFFASGDTWTPFKVTVLSLILNAVLDYVLMSFFGITGIAMATFCVAIITMIVLYNKLKDRIGRIEISQAFKSVIKIVLATGAMSITIWAMTELLQNYLNIQNLKSLFVEIGVLSIFSWVVFLLVCRFLKLEEYLAIELILGRKIGWQK